MADIRINALPLATGPTAPSASDNVALDGTTTRKSTLAGLADAIRPLASQAEAEAGVNAAKAMTPLTTKQSIASEVGLTLASNAQGAKADSALQPANIGTSVQGYSANLTTLAAVTPGAAGTSMLALAAAQDVRNFLKTSPYVATRTALKSLDTTKDAVVFLQEAGREGIFQWTAGDFSAQVTADTLEGVYVKATAIASSVGAWVRFGDPIIAHFGGSSTTNSATAAAAMASLLGYIRFGRGDTLMGTIVIDVPVYFDTGAALSAIAANTVSIRNRIVTEKQQVFKGAGLVTLDIATNNGEDSRMVHASWFGIFPQNGNAALDQTSLINKMFASMPQGREGVIDWDSGSYRATWDVLDPIPRGVWMRGSGIRRTTFDCLGTPTSSSKFFRTGGTAGKFTGIQFEHPAELGSPPSWLGTQVSIDHDDWFVDDVRCWNSRIGVALNGFRCEAHNVQSIYGVAVDADSATVRVRGSGCKVDNVRVQDTSNGPSAIVQVGGPGATANIENTWVDHVATTENSIGVDFYAPNNVNIQGFTVGSSINTGDEASPVAALIRFATFDNGSINLGVVGKQVTNGTCAALVRFDQASTAYTRDISIESGVAIGSGSGVIYNHTAGLLTDITLGDAVDLSDRSPAITVTGTPTALRFPPWLVGMPCTLVTIADDAVATLAPPRTGGGVCMIQALGSNGNTPNVNATLIATFRTVATIGCVKQNVGGSVFAVTSSLTLNGTAGVDGQATLGAEVGALKLENRLGSSQVFAITYFNAGY